MATTTKAKEESKKIDVKPAKAKAKPELKKVTNAGISGVTEGEPAATTEKVVSEIVPTVEDTCEFLPRPETKKNSKSGTLILKSGEVITVDPETQVKTVVREVAQNRCRSVFFCPGSDLAEIDSRINKDAEVYLVYSSEELDIWMDEKSYVDFEGSNNDYYYHGTSASKSKAKATLVVVNSQLDVKKVESSTKFSDRTCTLVSNIELKVGTLTGSQVVGYHHDDHYYSRLPKLEAHNIYDCDIALDGSNNKAFTLDRSMIIRSTINVDGGIKESKLVDVGLTTKRYSTIEHVELEKVYLNVRSLWLGKRNSERSWQRMQITDVNIYQEEDDIEIKNAFEIGHTGRGMNRHSLLFYPVRGNNGIRFNQLRVIAVGTCNEYDDNDVAITVDHDATRSEIREMVTKLLYPSVKKEGRANPHLPMGTIEDSIISEATAVLTARIRIIKQVRQLESL